MQTFKFETDHEVVFCGDGEDEISGYSHIIQTLELPEPMFNLRRALIMVLCSKVEALPI